MNQGSVLRSKDEKYDAAEFLIRQTAAYPIVGPHRHTKYFRNSAHSLSAPSGPMDIRYLVGLLNSKVVRFAYIAGTREAGQKAFPQVKLGAFGRLPMRQIDWSNAKQKKQHDEVVELVDGIIALNLQLKQAPGVRQKTIVQRIGALDDKLEDAVFELYEVSKEDRGVIEQVVAKAAAPPSPPPMAVFTAAPSVARVANDVTRRKASGE